MICVKCYRESQNGEHHVSTVQPLDTQMHAIVVYQGMTLCFGHFNRELSGKS
jgi:hypothetical protein